MGLGLGSGSVFVSGFHWGGKMALGSFMAFCYRILVGLAGFLGVSPLSLRFVAKTHPNP